MPLDDLEVRKKRCVHILTKFFNFSDEQQKQDERVGSTLVFNTNFASKEVDVGGLKVPDLSSSRILTLRT